MNSWNCSDAGEREEESQFLVNSKSMDDTFMVALEVGAVESRMFQLSSLCFLAFCIFPSRPESLSRGFYLVPGKSHWN